MSEPTLNPRETSRANAPLPAAEPEARLFPLPITPFEYYYLLEDRADYPSVFPIRLECQGPLDRDALDRAYRLAHGRHPFLSARVEEKRRGWPAWVAGEPAPIRWTEQPLPCVASIHAATDSPGVELQVSVTGQQSVLSFTFHHVAVDGMGGFQFISDMMIAYAHLCSGSAGPIPWPPLKRNLLLDRDGHGLFKRKLKWLDWRRLLGTNLPLLYRRAAVVRAPAEAPSVQDLQAGPGRFLIHTLTLAETAALSQVARSIPARLNDLLLRDYFLMLEQWNRDSVEGRRPLRVLVPTNLRRKQDYRMPAANVFSYAFLSRRGNECLDRVKLLESLRAEMATIRREKWGLYFEAGLRLACVFPELLRLSLKRKWPFATAVFTNLGAGFDHVPLPWHEGRRRAGDLLVENGYGAGPIRPETRVSLAVHTYAGQMSLAVMCDHQLFSPSQQQSILQAYLDQLRETMRLGY